VKYTDDTIIADYTYDGAPKVTVKPDGGITVEPVKVRHLQEPYLQFDRNNINSKHRGKLTRLGCCS